MEYKKYRLGDLIEQYDEINQDGEFTSLEHLQGINSNKYFQECKSNKNDIDLYRYRICRKGMFAYNRATSRNGEKISIAYRTGEDCLISPSYYVFSITRTDILLPEYFDIWMKRPDFDRYARFNSWGSATEFFTFEDFSDTEIKLPSIQEQQKVVNQYKIITDRIELLNTANNKLESISFAIFKNAFASHYTDEETPAGWKKVKLEDLCVVKGGKRLPAGSDLVDIPTLHPYIRVRDVGDSRYVCLTNEFQYIDNDTHESISRYIVNENDIIISIVGTIGLIGKIHHSLDGANLTENCVKLTNLKEITPDYLYYTLCYKKYIKEIESLTVGAVQAKLPMYNIQSMPILVPSKSIMNEFQAKIDVINVQVESNSVEIQKLKSMLNIILAKTSV